jgi:hypothetical protein
MKTDFVKRLAAIAIAAVLVPAAGLAAGNVPLSDPNAIVETPSVPAEPMWGGASRTFLTLGAWNAQPVDSTTTYGFGNFPGGQGVFRTGGSSWLKVPVYIPSGAVVSELELAYCDTGAGTIAAHWFRQPKNGPVVTQTNVVVSTGTPGCVSTMGAITPATIDNDANSYNIELFMSAADNTIVFLSVRVGYRLQVSPAPATASFADVPTTHFAFRFVEALAASGITGGCGGGNYCPDSPLTRAQMAIFLASALGLHFPN